MALPRFLRRKDEISLQLQEVLNGAIKWVKGHIACIGVQGYIRLRYIPSTGNAVASTE